MREGHGIEIWPNGDRYEGQYAQDKFSGIGELTTHGGKYKGGFKDGLKDGLGTIVFKNGCRYEGHWKKGRFHGRGLHLWPDGRKYEVIKFFKR